MLVRTYAIPGIGAGSVANPDSDHESVFSAQQPPKERFCIMHLFGRCKDPEHCTFGAHRIPDPIPDYVRKHSLFKRLLSEHGEPKATES